MQHYKNVQFSTTKGTKVRSRKTSIQLCQYTTLYGGLQCVTLYLISVHQSKIHAWLHDVEVLSSKEKCFIKLFELLSEGLQLHACASASFPFMSGTHELCSFSSAVVNVFYHLSAPMWHVSRMDQWPPAFSELFWIPVIAKVFFNIIMPLNALKEDWMCVIYEQASATSLTECLSYGTFVRHRSTRVHLFRRGWRCGTQTLQPTLLLAQVHVIGTSISGCDQVQSILGASLFSLH